MDEPAWLSSLWVNERRTRENPLFDKIPTIDATQSVLLTSIRDLATEGRQRELSRELSVLADTFEDAGKQDWVKTLRRLAAAKEVALEVKYETSTERVCVGYLLRCEGAAMSLVFSHSRDEENLVFATIV